MEGRISTPVHMFLLLPLIYEESRNNGKKIIYFKSKPYFADFRLNENTPTDYFFRLLSNILKQHGQRKHNRIIIIIMTLVIRTFYFIGNRSQINILNTRFCEIIFQLELTMFRCCCCRVRCQTPYLRIARALTVAAAFMTTLVRIHFLMVHAQHLNNSTFSWLNH